MSLTLLPLFRAAWFLALVVLFWQFVTPSPVQFDVVLNDKLVHAVVFAGIGLAGLALWEMPTSRFRVLLGLALYGALIEVIQWQVPGRSFEVADWLADIFGLLVAWIVIRAVSGKAAETSGISPSN